MDFGLINPVLDWISANPWWAGGAVMVIAFLESLALVGLFLPGAVLMFGVGALVGTGTLPLWPTLAWAAVGAIGGDGLSFWLGRHFHQRIRTVWPLRTHPQLLAQSTDFFHRHGGKSILFGRFVGPIRPVIPLVAGMLEMPTARFLPVNVLSGILWAPVYVLPGMVFAASLGVAAEVATRLALLLGTLLLCVLAVLWASRRLFDLYHRHAHRLLRFMLAWADRHPRLGQLPAALLDPAHPEARGLTLLGLLLLLAGATLLWLLQGWTNGLLPNLDQTARTGLRALRSPAADQLLLAIAGLGADGTPAVLFTTTLGWLAWRRHWLAAGHWLAAALFAALFSLLLQGLLPSAVGGTTPIVFSATLYGFLAALVAREIRERWRWIVYGLTALLLCGSGFAQIYLEAQHLSEVLIGLASGLLWATLLGIAYLRHPSEQPAARPLLLIALLSLLAAGYWYRGHQYELDLARFTPARATAQIDTAARWQSAWRSLPRERIDLRGRPSHPLTLQYAGALAPLRALLARHGWHEPVHLNAVSWLNWLALAPPLVKLPVLPQLHDGRYQQLLLVKPAADGDRLLTLRLWPGDVTLAPNDVPLWLGNVSYLAADHLPGGFTVLRTQQDFAAPLMVLRNDLQTAGWPLRWEGEGAGLLLLRAPAE